MRARWNVSNAHAEIPQRLLSDVVRRGQCAFRTTPEHNQLKRQTIIQFIVGIPEIDSNSNTHRFGCTINTHRQTQKKKMEIVYLSMLRAHLVVFSVHISCLPSAEAAAAAEALPFGLFYLFCKRYRSWCFNFFLSVAGAHAAGQRNRMSCDQVNNDRSEFMCAHRRQMYTERKWTAKNAFHLLKMFDTCWCTLSRFVAQQTNNIKSRKTVAEHCAAFKQKKWKTIDRQTSSLATTTTTTNGKWILAWTIISFQCIACVISFISDDLTITQFCEWARGDTAGELCDWLLIDGVCEKIRSPIIGIFQRIKILYDFIYFTWISLSHFVSFIHGVQWCSTERIAADRTSALLRTMAHPQPKKYEKHIFNLIL